MLSPVLGRVYHGSCNVVKLSPPRTKYMFAIVLCCSIENISSHYRIGVRQKPLGVGFSREIYVLHAAPGFPVFPLHYRGPNKVLEEVFDCEDSPGGR